MNLTELFQTTIQKLNSYPVKYALAGGMVASVYRDQPRTTADLDFLLYAESDTARVAREILHSLGLNAFEARKADLEGGPKFAIQNQFSPIYIIVGRTSEKTDPGVDFILPEIPWFQSALERAQLNPLDFGFGPIPCLTAEDIYISKVYSLRNDADRTDDLSDLKSIVQANPNLDLSYISSRMRELKLLLPRSLEKSAPAVLLRTSKQIKKNIVNKNPWTKKQ